MYDNEDDYQGQKASKAQPEKPKKATEDTIEDLDSLKKLEPLYKGSNSIKGFLARKTKTVKKS